MNSTTIEIAWAAGFLEGEGGFVACRNKTSSFTISAVQVQREPLERLLRLFGGHLKGYHRKKYGLIHRWTVNGSHAVSVGFTIFPFMSVKRKAQIVRIVEEWKACPGKNNRWKTECPRGHSYGVFTTFRQLGKRHCVTCYPSYAQYVERENSPRPGTIVKDREYTHPTHCPRGHEYTPENTMINSHTNGRYCRTCANERRRRSFEGDAVTTKTQDETLQ